MQNNNDGYSWTYLAITTISGVFGIINVNRWFRKPDEQVVIEKLEKIISEKNEIIKGLEEALEKYKNLKK